MRNTLLIAAVGLLAAASVDAQTALSGKWQTDNVPAALEAQKNAPPAEEGGRGRGAGGGQAIIVDLQVDASGKVSGTVTEIGNPPVLTIDSGMVDGKKVTWVTMPRGVTWTLPIWKWRPSNEKRSPVQALCRMSDALLAAPDSLRERHCEGVEVRLLIADADSENQAASRRDVDDRRVLGDVNGVIER